MLKNKKIPVVNISRCHSSTFESRQSLLNFKQSYVGEQRSFPPEHCEQSSYGPITIQFLKLLVSLIFVLGRLEEHIHSCCTGTSFLFVLESWEFSARQCLVPVAQCCYSSSARTGFVRNQLYSVALTLLIPGNITPSEPIWGVIITITKLSNKSDWLSTVLISAVILLH